MRVGIRANLRTSGGGRVFLSRLTDSLVQVGSLDPVLFVLADGDQRLEVDSSVVQVPVGSSHSIVQRRLLAARALRRLSEAQDIDVLLCPGTELVRITGVPSVIWPLTVAPFERAARESLGTSIRGRARWRVLRAAIESACRRADGAIFSSAYARDLHLDAVPALRRKPVAVVHPAPSLDESASSRDGGWPDLPVDAPMALFVSHLYPYKMVIELLRGFALFRAADGTDHHLVIAGRITDAAYGERIRSEIDHLGLRAHVHLVGEAAASTLVALYRSAQFFIFTSISENAGSYALLDAFHFGVPVIASSLSSMPEICGSAALAIDPRDPTAIAAAMDLVASDTQLRRELSTRARRRAAELPDWIQIGQQVTEFLALVR